MDVCRGNHQIVVGMFQSVPKLWTYQPYNRYLTEIHESAVCFLSGPWKPWTCPTTNLPLSPWNCLAISVNWPSNTTTSITSPLSHSVTCGLAYNPSSYPTTPWAMTVSTESHLLEHTAPWVSFYWTTIIWRTFRAASDSSRTCTCCGWITTRSGRISLSIKSVFKSL